MESVLITGASRGIGLALAQEFAQSGYRVLATYRGKPTPELEALKEQSDVTLLALEVTNESEVSALAKQLEHTQIDILINNAGILGPDAQNYDEINPAQWLEVFNVNTIAPVLLTRALLPNLKRANNPRIITISSDLGALANQENYYFAYSVSKAAVNKAMQMISNEVAAAKVIVCPIHPGWVQTDMGGSAATLTPKESAAGIMQFTEQLTLDQSGQFFDWNSQPRAW